MRSGRAVYSGAVAADLGIFPLGTRLRIEGLSGEYTVEDSGSGVVGYYVDIWMPSCDDALDWGRQTRMVEIVR